MNHTYRIALLLMLIPGLLYCDKAASRKSKPGPKGVPVTQSGSAQSLPSNQIEVPAHECKSSPECLKAGHCTFEQGSCVVKRDQDCEAASVCKHDGKCTAQSGRCIVAKNADCKQSKRCTHEGECVFKNGTCVAGSHADCKQSKDCKHKGECIFKNGECIAGKKK